MTTAAARKRTSPGEKLDLTGTALANVLDLDGKRIDWLSPPKPTSRAVWTKRDSADRKVTGSLRTVCHLDRLNRIAKAKYGAEIVVIQPPFNTTVPASAGTHDFDCCVDLYIPGVSWWEQQGFFRANGLMSWYRHPPTFGNHIHGFTLPPREGTSINDDFKVHGYEVGVYVDGGQSRQGRAATSSQIEDGYNHAFGLAGQHTPGSDRSWWPQDIESTIFDLDTYIGNRQRELERLTAGRGPAGQRPVESKRPAEKAAGQKGPGKQENSTGKGLVVHGADLSHHNQDPALIKARDAGLLFVYHKATEGTTVRDPKYPGRRAAARKAGLPFGAYHFASPDHHDAVQEARAFIEYADPEPGDLAPALDMEVAGSERLESWSKQFMLEVLRLLEDRGLRPTGRLVHYGPDDYGEDYPYLRWVPRYNNDNEPPVARFDIWQFSNGELGVPRSFPGLPGAVDLNTMRPGLELDSFRLERIASRTKPRAAAEARDKGTDKGTEDDSPESLGDDIACAHASLQFSLSPEQHTEDIEAIFGREAARAAKWITGTEAGPAANNTAEELRRVAASHGYRFFLPGTGTDCWIAVAEDFIDGAWETGYTKVLDNGKDAGDLHHYAERGVVWVQFSNTTYGTISIAAAHHLTHGRSPGAAQEDKPGDPVDHVAANQKLSRAIADWAAEHSVGRSLAFFGGDTNMRDKDSDVFFGAPLTTLWDELKVHQNTGRGNIDVIASSDNDGRVSAKSCEALGDREIKLHADHFLVEGAFHIRRLPQDH
jgi:GH25 family lysozyme M1 (1,4-beta-N-acetylmuramidase)